ncbi:hypothetical protein HZB01_01375 [Candidatus Woesearchaeota archaeon]|nr:hypothetical protein [Candidatus Woesearchaeota archaeon]
MDIGTFVRGLFNPRISWEQLNTTITSHGEDPVLRDGRRQIEEFWQQKIEEAHAKLKTNLHYHRLQELCADQNRHSQDKGSEIYRIRELLRTTFSMDGLISTPKHDTPMNHNTHSWLHSHYSPWGGEQFANMLESEFHQGVMYNWSGSFYLQNERFAGILSLIEEMRLRQEAWVQDALINYLGKKGFKAIYLCPAWAPTEMEIRKHGSWVYLDMLDLPTNKESITTDFYRMNPNSTFIKHDLTDANLPLPESSFDFVFYNHDYAGNGVTPKAAELMVKPKGIVMTRCDQETDPTTHTSLSRLGAYDFYKYQLLTKTEK